MSGDIVITGMGLISPIGNSIDEFWTNALDGVSGIETIFDKPKVATVGARVKDFNPEDYGIDHRGAKHMDPFSQFAVSAASQAIEDSGLDFSNLDLAARTGVFLGAGIGGLQTIEASYRRFLDGGRLSPMTIPALIINAASAEVGIRNGLHGPQRDISTACASGTDAIITGTKYIESGDMDVAIVGGTEAIITEYTYAAFSAMRAMSLNADPQTACRPFDLNRDGFVMGEGAGVLILESEKSARQRGANIYAKIAGYSSTSDAFHRAAPDQSGTWASQAIIDAMAMAGVQPTMGHQVYVNAHGTSTGLNDKTETAALKTAFSNPYDLSISSTKSMTGHAMGAAGGIEAIASVLALRHGMVPPTLGLRTPDPECDLNYTPGKSVENPVKYAMSNSFGFGGHNAVVIFRQA